MKGWIHRQYLYFLLVVSLIAFVVIFASNFSYYKAPLSERAFHPKHEHLKPAGKFGHGFGVVGSMMVILGVLSYSLRKRLRIMSGLGDIKDWLNIHIFLCLTGPLLVLLHTTFKFSGVAGMSMFSMISVVLSGVVGRYIYIQIPRGIKGMELGYAEIEIMRKQILEEISAVSGVTDKIIKEIDSVFAFNFIGEGKSVFSVIATLLWDDIYMRRRKLLVARRILKRAGFGSKDISKIVKLEKTRYILYRRAIMLDVLKKIFRFWHVVHIPFTLIMFILFVIHVSVAIFLGYKWLF